MQHTPKSAAESITRLRLFRQDAGRDEVPLNITIGAEVSGPDDLARWEEVGVDRIIVAPWARSPGAIDGLRRLADAVGLKPLG
jgi:hypothetical protein